MEIPSDGAETGDSSSEEEDEEALLRLREALDDKFTLSLPVSSSCSSSSPKQQTSHNTSPPAADVGEDNKAGEDCKSLSDQIKSQLNKFHQKSNEQQLCKNPKSLRRDKQDNVQLEVMSELNVTPQFQKFVGSSQARSLGLQLTF